MISLEKRQAALSKRFPQWIPRTLDQMLAAAAREFPERPLLITDQESFSYDAIHRASERIASGLWRAGIRPGDHVAIVLANYPEFAPLKFAISRVGAVAVPINFLNRRDELAYILEQSDAAMLITMDRFRDLDYLTMLDELVPDWATGGGGDRFPRLQRVVVYATGEGGNERHYMPFAELASSDGDAPPAATTTADAISDIIYTSGTTGGPKGVMLSHDMVLRTAFGSAYARGFQEGRRIIFSLPLYHVYGYVEGLMSVLFVGGAVIPQLTFDARETLRAIDANGAQDALLIPLMTQAMIDVVREEPAGSYDLSTFTAVISSGGKAPPEIWQNIIDHLGIEEITTGYGMSETTGSTTVTRPNDPLERLLTTNGRLRDVGVAGDPALNGRLVVYRVIDPLTGAELPRGEVGELLMRGPGVTPGYYNKPEATAAAMDPEGWMRSGDLGCIDVDDYISLKGRIKESYRCGGEQVLPIDAENVLTSHPAVAEAHVVPAPDAKMGEIGVAFVVLVEGAEVGADELIALCSERLARFKVPRHVLFINASELPTTATGRPRKFLLTERAIKLLDIP